MKHAAFIAASLGALLTAGGVSALEFDMRARRMGLCGIAWDETFTVYATDGDLAKETLGHVRDAYGAILSQLDQRLLRKRCLVFIWNDRRLFVLHGGTFGGRQIRHSGAFVIRDFWGGCHALFTFTSDDLYDKVLPHELAHLVLPLFLNPTRAPSIPLWLNEGFAQCQERDSLADRVRAVRAAVEKRALFPLKKLAGIRKYPPSFEEKRLFYAQSALLVRYLLENQRKRGDFYAFAYDLSCSGKPFESALKLRYPQWAGVRGLDAEFRRYVGRLGRKFRATPLPAASPTAKAAGGERKKRAAGRRARHGRIPRFDIGDPETKFTQILGPPDERQGMLFHMEKRTIYLGEKRRVKTKRSISDRMKASQLFYPGLSIVSVNGRALCLVAVPPFEGRVGGIAIGEPASRVVARMGRADYRRGDTLFYERMGGRFVYTLTIEKGRVAAIKAYRKKFKGMTLSF